MKIHHLNCGSMCPIGGRLLPNIFPKEICCHCLLIETSDKLILVDTGVGTDDLKNLHRLGMMRFVLGVQQVAAAKEHIERLGFKSSDITDIIPTHLDLDHAGGIPDFPHSRVHINKHELSAATSGKTFIFRQRYRNCHFQHDIRWSEFDTEQGEKWNGFECVNRLSGLPPEILLVRLPGHTPGHFGIAVQEGAKWLLHAGDAYYDHKELLSEKSSLGLRLFQRVAHTNYQIAMATQSALADLKSKPDVLIFSSHDPTELPLEAI